MAAFTRLAIRRTFLLLLEQMPLDKITVKMIVDACGVSRNTFYYHYEDIPALLKDTLEAELGQFRIDRDDRKDDVLQLLTKVANNRKIFDHIYHSSAREHLRLRLRDAILSLFLEAVAQQSRGRLDAKTQETIAVFYASAMTGACVHWLEDAENDPPEDFLARLALFDGLLEETIEKAAAPQG